VTGNRVQESEARARFADSESGRRSTARTRLRATALALGELRRAVRSGELTGRTQRVELIVAREAIRDLQNDFGTGPERLRAELDRLHAARKGNIRAEIAALRDSEAVSTARRHASEPFVERSTVARVYRADRGWAWEPVEVLVPRDRGRRWSGLKL
jgi:hypothetical protein